MQKASTSQNKINTTNMCFCTCKKNRVDTKPKNAAFWHKQILAWVDK